MTEGSLDDKVGDEVTPEIDWEAFIRNTPELVAAQEYGVDVWALITNCKRSVAERIERHKNALDSYHKFRNARLL